MTAETLTLFDELPPVRPAATMPCLWHAEPDTESTHRVVLAVDLMDPRWWQSGGLRPDGGLRACDGGRIRLHVIGSGYCGPCIARDAGAPFSPGQVRHFIPRPKERQP